MTEVVVALDERELRIKDLERQVEVLTKERDFLLREIKEWVCVDCNIMYPGPPQPGVMCVVCPRCGGMTMPYSVAQRRALEDRLDRQSIH